MQLTPSIQPGDSFAICIYLPFALYKKLFPTSLCGVLVFRSAPAAPRPRPRPPSAVHSSYTTHHISLILHHSSHARTALGEPGVQISWQAQYTEPSGGPGGRVGAAGPRLPFVWQVQHLVNLDRFRGRRSAQSLQEDRVDAWARKSVQECPTRVPHKSVLQECFTRVSYKSVPQECPTRVSVIQGVPQQCVLQECQKCLLQECQKYVGCLFSSTCLQSGSWVPIGVISRLTPVSASYKLRCLANLEKLRQHRPQIAKGLFRQCQQRTAEAHCSGKVAAPERLQRPSSQAAPKQRTSSGALQLVKPTHSSCAAPPPKLPSAARSSGAALQRRQRPSLQRRHCPSTTRAASSQQRRRHIRSQLTAPAPAPTPRSGAQHRRPVSKARAASSLLLT